MQSVGQRVGSVKVGVGTGVVVGGIILVVRGNVKDMPERDSVPVSVIVMFDVSVSEFVGEFSKVRVCDRSSDQDRVIDFVNVTVRVLVTDTLCEKEAVRSSDSEIVLLSDSVEEPEAVLVSLADKVMDS
jgi:hypothetical protein